MLLSESNIAMIFWAYLMLTEIIFVGVMKLTSTSMVQSISRTTELIPQRRKMEWGVNLTTSGTILILDDFC